MYDAYMSKCKDKCQLNYCNETGVGNLESWPTTNTTTDGSDMSEEFNATEVVKAAKDGAADGINKVEASEATTLAKSAAADAVNANA